MRMTEIRKASYWGSKIVELGVAAAVAVALISYKESLDHEAKQGVSAEEWFRVNEIYVPDHEVGSNPLMIYDRDILEPHRGFWIVEAQRQVKPGEASFFNECSGSGVDNYDSSDVLPDSGVSWAWFFNRQCSVPPGIYRIEMTKDLSIPGWPVKSMRPVYSNTFRIYPRGELPKVGK